ncbi:M23 family metallopeptidase [Candidatus Peregrinibacteria bacterium]|nr:M23 family metallopeptidase [Candidatus Peregrinibacteria bacterium]
MALKHKKRIGFSSTPLHRGKDFVRYPFEYLRQRSSFWIAALSLIAFVAGNMVGQHGWYAFWRSVWGGYEDHLIVYTGTVAPIEAVPDYEAWARYGGDWQENTYRQVPVSVLTPLPPYRVGEENDAYSMGHLGSYEHIQDGTGSHPGVDIRVPEGTPVVAIANGIVEQVREDGGGFGKLVVIRHPHVPDPLDATKTTVLHSVYAHLNAQLVSEGQVVQKGEKIGLSGKTGFVTGPHLHFQIDRDDAPWHPYWPFTMQEARLVGLDFVRAVDRGFHRERGALYTIHPMLYVQANDKPVEQKIIALVHETESQSSREYAQTLTRRDGRRSVRLARAYYAKRVGVVATTKTSPQIVRTELVASLEEGGSEESHNTITNINVVHDGKFSGRGWERLEVQLVGDDGAIVRSVRFTRDIALRTAYGEAEFRPQSLSPLDFQSGIAYVYMLPRGHRTVVIRSEPFGSLSEPMKYQNE